MGHAVLSINGVDVVGKNTAEGKDIMEYLKDPANYPVSIRFGRARLSSNEKLMLASMFHSWVPISTVGLEWFVLFTHVQSWTEGFFFLLQVVCYRLPAVSGSGQFRDWDAGNRRLQTALLSDSDRSVDPPSQAINSSHPPSLPKESNDFVCLNVHCHLSLFF